MSGPYLVSGSDDPPPPLISAYVDGEEVCSASASCVPAMRPKHAAATDTRTMMIGRIKRLLELFMPVDPPPTTHPWWPQQPTGSGRTVIPHDDPNPESRWFLFNETIKHPTTSTTGTHIDRM